MDFVAIRHQLDCPVHTGCVVVRSTLLVCWVRTARAPGRPEPGAAMKSTILAVLLAVACTGVQGQPASLHLMTEPSPPYSMHDGKHVIGIATDTVRAVMDRAGIAYSLDLLPWRRAYSTALERADTCVYSTTRIPEREADFKWVGPIAEADWVLMARADRAISLRSLDDAHSYRIGTYNGDARDQYLRARGFDVDPAPDDLTNPRKLMAGRIDLWAASTQRGSATLDRLGYSGKIVPVLAFNHIRLYLACNRSMPDALVARLNDALASLERDGSRKAIRQRYDNWQPGQAGTAGR
jgi:polar amino acid transport system substrate-binding protein